MSGKLIFLSRNKLTNSSLEAIIAVSKRESEIEIKIETQEVLYGNKSAKFELDSFKKKCLMEGIDDIGLSLGKVENIQQYENKIKKNKPWLTNND